MNKDNLEKLKAAAKARFDGAKTPEEVKAATQEIAYIEDFEKEADELEKSNLQLLASYKEAIKGESVTTKKPPEEDEEGEPLEFDEALQKVLDQRPKSKQ